MTTTNDLPARLLEHAAVHDAATSPYDDEQAQWAQDLRDAAVLVERTQWRDIATAPEDCEKFHAWIVADDGCEWFEQDCYIDEEGDIRDRSGNIVGGSIHQWATHWMPPIVGPSSGA